MTESPHTWTENDSLVYRQLAAVAVPNRKEQLATLLSLIPFGADEAFRVVELASGEGALSYAILDCFPEAAVMGLDGSAAMRAHATDRLKGFADRFTVEPFDMAETDWHDRLAGADVVVSSLCVHHLADSEKRQLFGAIYHQLSSAGVLLLADLVMPQRDEIRTLFADTWDRSAAAQSRSESGSDQLYQAFVTEKWNYYRHPDPLDQPSTLFEQLIWLKAVGFEVVDAFWMMAGHAIYGGYKSSEGLGTSVSFDRAMQSAEAALAAISQPNTPGRINDED